MLVKFILNRTEHNDSLYETGVWLNGEVKDVPDLIGAKLIRHTDVFVKHDATIDDLTKSIDKVIVDEKPTDYTPEDAARDMINSATRVQLTDFIETQYGVKVNQRSHPTVDDVRAEASMRLDQYGLLV